MSDGNRESLERLLQTLLTEQRDVFQPAADHAPLAVPLYGIEEILAVVDSLLTGRVTMGEKTRRFESAFADALGVRHAVMVHSGSSANLLMAFALTDPVFETHLKPGDEIVVPALTWPTTIVPFVQAGLRPVVVDIDRQSFTIRPDAVRDAIGPKTRAICAVPILGHPPEMTALGEIATRHDLLLVEDSCEALGSRHRERPCGTFGRMATFSFFFSHQITTIEGGMVVTDDDTLADVLRSLRSHGWTRHLADPEPWEKASPDIDPRFLFIRQGFNVRPTELQAAFGLHQLPRLESFNDRRRVAAGKLTALLKDLSPRLQLPSERAGDFHTWFGYPFLVTGSAGRSRQELVDHLERRRVQTRPVIGGNLMRHPAFEKLNCRVPAPLDVAERVHREGVYVGIHPGTTDGVLELISRALHETLDP